MVGNLCYITELNIDLYVLNFICKDLSYSQAVTPKVNIHTGNVSKPHVKWKSGK